ncbi:hypothetical protein LOAG_08414 [Loa loa]|uniref:Uncharacterized protein n=1 Tax=Loa loa TaxID=7209 RepID=A0A1S0TTS6_LOALO|nr:hypothetical protein LOAG_08414 [Loa loa]EFO20076.1 hypothetical protein LOAG_08414 [Loa loa]
MSSFSSVSSSNDFKMARWDLRKEELKLFLYLKGLSRPITAAHNATGLVIGHVSLRKKYLPRSMGTKEVVVYKSNNNHFPSRVCAMVGLFFISMFTKEMLHRILFTTIYI